MEKFEALKKAKASERHYPSDYWGNNDPRCPHCDGDFTVSTRVSYSFSTDEQEDA